MSNVYAVFFCEWGNSNDQLIALYSTYEKAHQAKENMTALIYHEDYDSFYEVRTLGVY